MSFKLKDNLLSSNTFIEFLLLLIINHYVDPFVIKSGDKEVKGLDGLNFEIQKVSSKGGLSIRRVMEFPEFGADNYLIAFDKNKATTSTIEGATVSMKISTIGNTVFDYDFDVKASFKMDEEINFSYNY